MLDQLASGVRMSVPNIGSPTELLWWMLMCDKYY